MDGYNKLNFIDKIKFNYRVWKQEKLENKKQSLGHNARLGVDKQSIINELLAERENKKNHVKSLPPSESQYYKKSHNTLKQYEVPKDSVKSYIDILSKQEEERLELMLSKPLTSEQEAYDNIIELKSFLEYPHDNLPSAENKVYEKLYYIQTILGKDILDKGIAIYENDSAFRKMYNGLTFEDRIKLEQEIINNPKLAEQLSVLRYDPEKSKNLTGRVLNYLAVYSKMTETANYNDKDNQISNERD